jgi:hypothetical protein
MILLFANINKNKMIFNFLYNWFLNLAKILKGKNPDYSAKLYCTWILISWIIPFIFYFLNLILSKEFLFCVGCIVMFLLFYFTNMVIGKKMLDDIKIKKTPFFFESTCTLNKLFIVIISFLMLIVPITLSFILLKVFF